MAISWRLLPSVLRDELDVEPRTGWVPRSVHDFVTDVGSLVVAALVGLLSGLGQLKGAYGPLMIVFGVAACLSLLVRRRWPIALAVVLNVASVFLMVANGAVLVATFSVAVHRRLAAALWIGVLGVVTGVVNRLLFPDPDLPLLASVLIGVLLTVAAVGWGTLVRARRQLLVSLAERARLAEADQHGRIVEVRRAERARLAREMHDVLAHRMSLISVHAGALEFRPSASEEEIARAAGVIRSGVHQMLVDLREVIGLLREEPGDTDVAAPPQPSLSGVADLVGEARLTGAEVELDLDVRGVDEVPTMVGRTAYRIVQEGLTNARKHAPGEPVRVTLRGGAGDGLAVEVRQPLSRVGRASIPGSGVGLSERAVLAGGRLEHGPTDGGAYLLRAWLPWEA